MEHLKLEEGFRFRPTDSEGLTFLLRFVAGQEMHDAGFITTNIDVYGKQEPWEIYDNGVPCGDDEDNSSYCYFITKLKKKSNARYHRSVRNKGTWKQDAKDKPVHYKTMGNTSSVVNIGSKTCLSYKNKMFYPEDQRDGHWLMKEYELSKVILHKLDEDRRDYVLCAIKKLKHVNSSSETSTTTMLNFDQSVLPDMYSNSAHVVYSEVADHMTYMSQINSKKVPEDVLGLDLWDIMNSDELHRILEDVSECCPNGC
ncbi:NAC domain-containing protein 41-like [Nicotiana sylvestris]|uniref:Protein ATAF2-like n=1 Tax=Nicotiana sylvestris TaxID=4096 RepID=A0A1U7Y9M1_NICSY|nr:PREDICTED: protein ATAF2-like [Nicotiana sylvestris]